MGRRKGIPGLSFSWKRAVGLIAAKSKLSRQLGVPLTQAGRQRKLGRAMGCCAPFVAMVLGGSAALALGLLGWPGEVAAHGGGLNAEGCHNNRKTGDYHCHRGQPLAVLRNLACTPERNHCAVVTTAPSITPTARQLMRPGRHQCDGVILGMQTTWIATTTVSDVSELCLSGNGLARSSETIVGV